MHALIPIGHCGTTHIRLLDLPENPFYLNALAARGAALELKDIKAIIDLMKENDLSVFEMEKDGFQAQAAKRRGRANRHAPAAPTCALLSGTRRSSLRPRQDLRRSPAIPLKDIVSPMVGTFYRAASPESPPFADVGKDSQRKKRSSASSKR